jgi:hypothetical protein
MSRIKGVILTTAGLSSRAIAVLGLGFVLFSQQPGQLWALAREH